MASPTKKNTTLVTPPKHLLNRQFVAWSCNRWSFAPLTGYINNPVYQELINEDPYNCVRSDEGVYLDLRASPGYTFEAKKLKRNNSKINLFIQLKRLAAKS